MTKINDKFIGNNITNSCVDYTVGDDEERFLDNLQVQPDDWYYRHHKITYEYNRYGHRCKNLEDIDLSNYLLFSGCSHTEGIGLQLEKTYPHIVASTLGLDYYNLGVSGTGIDVMSYNLTMWHKLVISPPKALIIMRPEPTRFVTTIEKDYLRERLISDGCPDTARFIAEGEAIKFFDTRYRLQMKLIHTLFDTSSIIEMEWFPEDDEEVVPLNTIDRARDLCHSGIISNYNSAQILIDRLR